MSPHDISILGRKKAVVNVYLCSICYTSRQRPDFLDFFRSKRQEPQKSPNPAADRAGSQRSARHPALSGHSARSETLGDPVAPAMRLMANR